MCIWSAVSDCVVLFVFYCAVLLFRALLSVMFLSVMSLEKSMWLLTAVECSELLCFLHLVESVA